MDAQGFRALAQRCRDLSQIAAGLEVREQLHEWVDDLEDEAEAVESRPSLRRLFGKNC
jgi:HPt (histidine-containing phosphotransfer) domain-containing protein